MHQGYQEFVRFHRDFWWKLKKKNIKHYYRGKEIQFKFTTFLPSLSQTYMHPHSGLQVLFPPLRMGSASSWKDKHHLF